MHDSIEDLVKKNCGPYLKDLKQTFKNGTKKVLRRGSAQQIDDYIELSKRTERKSKDTLPGIHEAANKWFYQNFNVNARKEGIFCTSSKTQASDYGTAYIIFPIGKYNLIYSNEVIDLFYYVTERKVAYYINPEYNLKGDENEYQQAVRTVRNSTEDQIYKSVKKVLDNANYKNGNLEGALRSGNEIALICDKYYMINPNNLEFMEFLYNYLMEE